MKDSGKMKYIRNMSTTFFCSRLYARPLAIQSLSPFEYITMQLATGVHAWMQQRSNLYAAKEPVEDVTQRIGRERQR